MAIRKMHEDKECVDKLAPIAQFTMNCASWQKSHPEALDESKLNRQLAVIETAAVNVATSKRALKDVLVDEITRSRPSGGLLSFYAAMLRDAEKRSIALDAVKVHTEKFRRARRDAFEQKQRAVDQAEALAQAAAAAGAGGGGGATAGTSGARTNSGQKGPPGGPSPAKLGEWSEADVNATALCVEGYEPPAGSASAVTSLASDEVVLVEKFKIIKGELWAKIKATGKHVPASFLRRFANVELDDDDFASDHGGLDDDDFASDDDGGGAGADKRAATAAAASAAAARASAAAARASAAASTAAVTLGAAAVARSDGSEDEGAGSGAATSLSFDTPSPSEPRDPSVPVAIARPAASARPTAVGGGGAVATLSAVAAVATPSAVAAVATPSASLLCPAPRPAQVPPPPPDAAAATAATTASRRGGGGRHK